MQNFSVNVKAQDVRAAVRVGLSVGIPLYTIYAFGRLNIEVFAAFGALTSLYGHTEPPVRRVETQLAVGAGLVTTIAAAAVFAALHGPQWLLGLMLLAVVPLAGTLGTVMKWPSRGEIFFILVLLVISALPLVPSELPLAIVTSAGGAAISIFFTLIEIKGERDSQPVAYRLLKRAGSGAASLDKRQHIIVIGFATLGVITAWLLASALKIGHPYWAPTTVAAIIPALVSPDALRRATHLLLGTSGGVCLAALFYFGGPSPLVLVSLIVMCQILAEVFVARNYATALLFFTPLAIGMSNMGRDLPWKPLLTARAIEAGIGTCVALAVIVIGRRVLAKLAPLPLSGNETVLLEQHSAR